MSSLERQPGRILDKPIHRRVFLGFLPPLLLACIPRGEMPPEPTTSPVPNEFPTSTAKPTSIPRLKLPTQEAQEDKSYKVCVQVITPAYNLQTGECREFPTPCDVPDGWRLTRSCTAT